MCSEACQERGQPGLCAVAGGLGEMFAVCGIGAILIGQAIATFLLPYCSDILARRLKAKLVSRPVDLHEGLMLLFVGPFLWLTWFQSDHTF